jgi:RHS repeat-associated protein
MSRGTLTSVTGAVVRAVTAGGARGRRRVAVSLARVGVAGLLVLLLPTSALAQSGQIVEYYHLDALGSVRVVTDQNAQVVSRHDFLPFGEEWPAPQPTTKEKKLFTGHERDAETGLDYFGARYYRANLGRFTTVDPVYTLKENLEDPQRWNRYAYARNNPLRYTDPDGRAIVCGSAACQEYARRMAELKREYESASGFAKGWAFVKYALAAGEIMSIGTMALTVPRAGVEGVSVVLGEGMSRVEAVAKELGAGIFEGGTGAHVPLDVRNLGWLQA